MNTCPFFGKCGGCAFDATAVDYREHKLSLLNHIPITQAPVWIHPGTRRRADFSVNDGKFGFFAGRTNDIVPVRACPMLTPALNGIIPAVAALPFTGSANILMTECANGIDVNITSRVPYYSPAFTHAAASLPSAVIRATWNGKDIFKRANPPQEILRFIGDPGAPFVEFVGQRVEFPAGAFLQPSVSGENVLRELIAAGTTLRQGSRPIACVTSALGPSGYGRQVDAHGKIADLFCGLGAFTLPFGAVGFDNFAPGIDALNAAGGHATTRDLFKKPLTARELARYDAIIMDPPRAGAESQCKQIARAGNVRHIAYVSCNAETFMRDAKILESGGYRLTQLTPVDQFVGTAHWELVGIFEK